MLIKKRRRKDFVQRIQRDFEGLPHEPANVVLLEAFGERI
jgi:hypothetical protein